MSKAYAKAGVDIVKADLLVSAISKMVKPTLTSKVRKSIGGYAALYETRPGHYIAATTDGVGTKLKLAFELGVHDTVGIDLVAMSVNDLICVGATPLFFLDYFATGKLSLKVAASVIKGIVDGCKKGKLALIGGETAEMPGMYVPGEYDLAGFAVGTVERASIIDGKNVRPGDLLVGFKSSGPHSNGFSLIRKLVSKRDLRLVRTCFTPTRIYVDEVMSLRKKLGKKLKGLAHITGSGFLNIPRINENVDYEITMPKNFKTPDVFLELKKRGSISWEDMYTTFNMGFGLIAAVSADAVSKLPREAVVIGKVKKKIKSKSQVTVHGPSYTVTLDY